MIQRGGLYIATPKIQRGSPRPPVIPQTRQSQRRVNLKELENEMGGPGVFNFPLQEHFELEREEWKYDIVPEIMDGKNIADFVDKDVLKKLEELEAEEQMI